MIRGAVLVCTTIVVGAFIGGSLPQPFSLPIGVARAQTTVAPCDANNPNTFLKNLRMLSGYDPDPNQLHGKTSLPSGSQFDQKYCNAFTSAYNLATPSFKNALDGLTATFVDTDSCGAAVQCAWGFKDIYTKGTGQTYVALSSSFFDSTGAVLQTYSKFVSSIVSALLIGAPSPITVQVSTDTQELALIAALAHELGHVKWFQNNVEKLNKTTKTCLDPVTNNYAVFANITWNNSVGNSKWRYFGKETKGNKPYGGVDKDQLYSDLGNSTAVMTDLRTIFNGSWSSIFSTVSPDEDYVETYTMISVIQALLQTSGSYLKIALPNGQVLTDMINDYTKSTDTNHRDFNHKQQWVLACAM